MSKPLNLAALIPEHFARYFAFFTPGHTQGIVPARIKELARAQDRRAQSVRHLTVRAPRVGDA